LPPEQQLYLAWFVSWQGMSAGHVDEDVEVPEERIDVKSEHNARSSTPAEIEEDLPDEPACKLRKANEQLMAQLQSLRLKTQLATLSGALEASASLSARRRAYVRTARQLQEEARQLREQPIDLARADQVTRLEDELKARDLELSRLKADGVVLSNAVEERNRAWEIGEGFAGGEQKAVINALRNSLSEKRSLVGELRSERAAADQALKLRRRRCDKLAAMLKVALEDDNITSDPEKISGSAESKCKQAVSPEEKERRAREEVQAQEKAAQLREVAEAIVLKREKEAQMREAAAKEAAQKRLQENQALSEKYQSEVAESEQEVEKGAALLRALRAAVQMHQRREAKEAKESKKTASAEGENKTHEKNEPATGTSEPPKVPQTNSQFRVQGRSGAAKSEVERPSADRAEQRNFKKP